MTDDDLRPLAGRTLLFYPRYSALGPSSRLRMGQFIPAFEAAGARVRVEPFFDDDYLHRYFEDGSKSLGGTLRAYARRVRALRSQRADLVWIEKELLPFAPAGIETRIGSAIPYVVDYDDATFHSYDLHRLGLVRRLLGNKLDPLLAGAALVTAGNDYLADYATAHGARDVVQVPTVVDPRRYPVRAPRQDAALRVGWIGTPANARYLAPVVEALNRLGAERPVMLVTIGAGAVPGLGIPHEAHLWTEDGEGPLLASIDVGVMPLPDSPWERGKCGYKLIQYMAAGRPVVASPVGVNTRIVDAEVGFLASSADEWLAAFRALAADADARHRMGAAARTRVETVYSIDAVAPVLVARFAAICNAAAAA